MKSTKATFRTREERRAYQIEYEKEQAVKAEKLKRQQEEHKQKLFRLEQERQAAWDAIHKKHPGLLTLLDEYLNTFDDNQYHESWETHKETAEKIIEGLKDFFIEKLA